mgnify:CR=1 FL=1
MRSVHRFGQSMDNDDDDDVLFGDYLFKFLTRRYLFQLLVICIVLMWCFSPISMIIGPLRSISNESARVLCQTESIVSEAGIRMGLLSYGTSDKLDVHLYTTSITRTIRCIDAAEKSTVLQYKDDYLNISTVDIDAAYKTLTESFHIGTSFNAWFYMSDDCYIMQRKKLLDRNCLSQRAIELDEYYEGLGPMSMMLLDSIFILTIVIHGAILHALYFYSQKNRLN